jgi:hypothetical protein
VGVVVVVLPRCLPAVSDGKAFVENLLVFVGKGSLAGSELLDSLFVLGDGL